MSRTLTYNPLLRLAPCVSLLIARMIATLNDLSALYGVRNLFAARHQMQVYSHGHVYLRKPKNGNPMLKLCQIP